MQRDSQIKLRYATQSIHAPLTRSSSFKLLRGIQKRKKKRERKKRKEERHQIIDPSSRDLVMITSSSTRRSGRYGVMRYSVDSGQLSVSFRFDWNECRPGLDDSARFDCPMALDPPRDAVLVQELIGLNNQWRLT